jgi:mannose-1-phosphate guanylyltransferase
VGGVKILPVIMCGGFGTRIWPESRESLPKQFPRIGQRSTFQTIVSVVGDSSVFDQRWSSPITNIALGSLSNCG